MKSLPRRTDAGLLALAVFTVLAVPSISTLAQCLVAETDRIVASDGEANDKLAPVALSGNVAAGGANGDDDNGDDAGAIYIQRRAKGSWSEEVKLLASDGGAGDRLGTVVAIDGDVVVAGADNVTSGGPGAAYVFRFDGAGWNEEQKLTASDGANGDRFGVGVGIDGDVIVVGASFHDAVRGAAYVFRYDGDQWVEEEKLTASNASPDDAFGTGVSISGDAILVGSRFEDTLGPGAGAAYAYRFDGKSWNEEQIIRASDGDLGDQFGIRVDLDGDRAVIGAWFDESLGASSGSAYVFGFDGAQWIQERKLLASDGGAGDRFGSSVAVLGDFVLVGARHTDNPDPGSAYLFQCGSWAEAARLDPAEGTSNDNFGNWCDLDSTTALIGAPFAQVAGVETGAVSVFSLTELCPCLNDLDGSGAVDFGDLLRVLGAWGNTCGSEDLDGSGTVDFGDLLVVLGAWGPCV